MDPVFRLACGLRHAVHIWKVRGGLQEANIGMTRSACRTVLFRRIASWSCVLHAPANARYRSEQWRNEQRKRHNRVDHAYQHLRLNSLPHYSSIFLTARLSSTRQVVDVVHWRAHLQQVQEQPHRRHAYEPSHYIQVILSETLCKRRAHMHASNYISNRIACPLSRCKPSYVLTAIFVSPLILLVNSPASP